jgi:hypothetical protein
MKEISRKLNKEGRAKKIENERETEKDLKRTDVERKKDERERRRKNR